MVSRRQKYPGPKTSSCIIPLLHKNETVALLYVKDTLKADEHLNENMIWNEILDTDGVLGGKLDRKLTSIIFKPLYILLNALFNMLGMFKRVALFI